MNDIPELSLLPAFDLRELVVSRTVSPREVAAACLARVHALDPRIRAFVTIDEAMAAAMADDVERRLSERRALCRWRGFRMRSRI